MARRRLSALASLAIVMAALGSLNAGRAAPVDASAIDCAGPEGNPAPGTAEWRARDARNMYCAEQRHLDSVQHPAAIALGTGAGQPANDGYRNPARHDNVRFRFQTTTVGGLSTEVYRPCRTAAYTDALGLPLDCPNLQAGLERFDPPYPAVVSAHGGLSRKELHWWSSQPLVEAGYVVVSWKSSGTSPTQSEATSMIDYALAQPDVDASRIGIAGHSAGGVVANGLQSNPNLAAIVSWDRAQSSELPSNPAPSKPSMFFFSDYNCQQVPVCQPQPYLSPPTPDGPGNKGNDYTKVVAAGVDAMQIALRATLHLDFVPSQLAGNRYAESVVMFFTTAWFDRYLKGKYVAGQVPPVAEDEWDEVQYPGPSGRQYQAEAMERARRLVLAQNAFARLTASTFDDSADVHNISQGLWDPEKAVLSLDPVYGGNVPYTIVGMPVTDRVSFYYLSKCNISVPGTSDRALSNDIRADAGCHVQ